MKECAIFIDETIPLSEMSECVSCKRICPHGVTRHKSPGKVVVNDNRGGTLTKLPCPLSFFTPQGCQG